MKVLIDISEEDFTLIRSVNNPDFLLLAESRVMLAVKNGTPLDTIMAEIMAEINELYSYVEFDEDIKTSFNMVRLEEVQKVIDKYKGRK